MSYTFVFVKLKFFLYNKFFSSKVHGWGHVFTQILHDTVEVRSLWDAKINAEISSFELKIEILQTI